MGCSNERNFYQANDKFSLLNMMKEENFKILEHLHTIEDKASENYQTRENFLTNAEIIAKKLKGKFISKEELEKLKHLLTEYYQSYEKSSKKEIENQNKYLQDYINFCLLSIEINL
jgi:hypothetical protein